MDVSKAVLQFTESDARESPVKTSAHQHDYSQRVVARGKFLFLGDQKFWIKGVTYGTFKPADDGTPFPPPDVVRSDFKAMSALGINTVRTYTVPPGWLLDLAQACGLRVLAGLAWEQHVTFLDDPELCRAIKQQLRESIRACQQHPAILCYSIGNEIPASIVRWHGRRNIEKFIKCLYEITKQEDPESLVTYVNYPTTEYLQLNFLDICCFNVYLENEQTLNHYLARLQNLAHDKPLLMAEIGLDSQRNGESEQAAQLEWQIRTAFSRGCSGAIVFAWTDEWYRGGFEIEDWDFGLCRRDRSPKPALDIVRNAYANVPFPLKHQWPKISVVVCSCNGESFIRDTLDGLFALDYPDYEVIVVNDGSKDGTASIVAEYEVLSIITENHGLSNARNTGWQAASGEIIVYIDDDAYPDPHWLQFLAHTYLTTDFAAVGGLSPAPAGDGRIAECVANAPGRPVHVLLTDTEAEHIPGCNMSFRRNVLKEIGGFDPRFRQAGDDVDICWRVLEKGWKIGYQASAMNWHHCRNSIKTYWKQQKGYGKAEALLEQKWPEKYNAAGQLMWKGRIYNNIYSDTMPFKQERIYQGQWGSSPYQSIYSPVFPVWSAWTLMPECYYLVGLLGCLAVLGLLWPPLLLALPLLALLVVIPITQAVASGCRVQFPTSGHKTWQRFRLRGITTLLFMVQPLARLRGRLQSGLTPWRRRIKTDARAGGHLKHQFSLWSEKWLPSAQWLHLLEDLLKVESTPLIQGGDFDSWDMEIRGGLFGSARLLLAVEDHAAGKQYLRIGIKPRTSVWAITALTLFGSAGLAASLDGALVVSGILAGMTILIFHQLKYEMLTAVVSFNRAISNLEATCSEFE